MKGRQIGDVILAFRASTGDENAVIQAELQDALDRGDWIICASDIYDDWANGVHWV